MSFFDTFLGEPLLNGLIILYNTAAFSDLGIAIVLLTIVIRFALYPLFYKSLKNQSIMQKIQPEIKKIQHDHKDNKEKQAQLMMELWKTHKVNPFSGFVLLVVQLPILIVLYQILRNFSHESLDGLYSFVTTPETVNTMFLGLINLEERSIFIVGLAVILQYVQTKLSLPKGNDKANKLGKQMSVIGPVITLFVLLTLPAAVGVYWATTAGFSIFQQIYINKSLEENHGNQGTISRENKKDS